MTKKITGFLCRKRVNNFFIALNLNIFKFVLYFIIRSSLK